MKKFPVKKMVFYATLSLVILFALFVRLYNLSSLPPPIHPDEAFMTESAIGILEKDINLLETRYSATVIANIFVSILIWLYGVYVWCLRLPSAVLGFATNIFLYLLIRDLWNKRIAVVAFIIGSFSHIAIAYSRLNLPNIQAPFLFIFTLFLINYAIQKKSILAFISTGIAMGISLYSYTGAKMVIFFTLLFMITQYKKRVWRWAYIAPGLILISIPLLLSFTKTNNYLERESQVTIITKPELFYDRWKTTNVALIFFEQVKINIASLFTYNDNSNQYGNGPLLDNLSQALLIIFFFITLPALLFNKNRARISIVFFMACFTLLICLISLTESPPLSTRLLIIYPLISLFIALSIDQIYRLTRNVNRFIGTIFLLIILASIIAINTKLYFIDYVNTHNAYYNWIEPNGSIAKYALANEKEPIYLLSNPHTYRDQLIISTLMYKKKSMRNIQNSDDFIRLIKQEKKFVLIVPLVPKEAISANNELYQTVLFSMSSLDIKPEIYRGIACKKCGEEPIFLTFTKL